MGDENDDRKRKTYWYRVSRDRTVEELGIYGTAQVVCWVEGEVKGSMVVQVLFDQQP